MTEQVFTNCTNAGPVSVYVKDGKVVRIRPLVADENDYKPWVIEADGKSYSPPKKVHLTPYVHGERRRLYSDERIKYPMKRVDFDPNGERNTQNRGKSAYARITWNEALDIVAGEIKGGPVMFQLRAGVQPVPSLGDRLDVLLAFNDNSIIDDDTRDKNKCKKTHFIY